MKTKIEFVCTGNSGRSPMAEELANMYIVEQKLSEYVRISSSGSHVAQGIDFPDEFMLPYIERAWNNGELKILQEGILEIPRIPAGEGIKNLDRDDLERIILGRSCREKELRNLVLGEKGIHVHKTYGKQTIISDSDYILPMKDSNTKKVEEIYAGKVDKPKITTLSTFIGEKDPIDDPFAGTIEDFRRCRDQIQQYVISAVDRIIRRCK